MLSSLPVAVFWSKLLQIFIVFFIVEIHSPNRELQNDTNFLVVAFKLWNL